MNGQNFLANPKIIIPPDQDEIEISVFGKGYGESIVLHCGNGEFVVVDSFVNPETNRPIALDYLISIGYPVTAIKALILTHWHDDHIRGAFQIISEIPDIDIVLSGVFSKKAFLIYISSLMESDVEQTTEMHSIMTFLKENNKKPILASRDKRVYANEPLNNAELFALSPQDSDVLTFIKSISKPQVGKSIDYSLLQDNHCSIVLLMKYGNDGMLLGGDLENSTNKDSGWEAIVKNYSHQKTTPTLFKVPHHGSKTGYCDAVWSTILAQKPISVLTVYNKGKKLPTEREIKQITAKSKELYIVGNKNAVDKEIRKTIHKVMPNKTIETISQNLGMFRYRKKVQQNPEIECFGDCKVSHN